MSPWQRAARFTGRSLANGRAWGASVLWGAVNWLALVGVLIGFTVVFVRRGQQGLLPWRVVGLVGLGWLLLCLFMGTYLTWSETEDERALLDREIRTLRNDIEGRAPDLVVEVPDRIGTGWREEFEGRVAFSMPLYLVNRSRTENVNLRFGARARVSNFDPPEMIEMQASHTVDVTDRSTGERTSPEWLANPLHLDPQTNRQGPLCLVFEIEERSWSASDAVLISDCVLLVTDEQSGTSHEFQVPGRHETRPR